MAFSTEAIMELALQEAGLTELPPDSGILVPGTGINKVGFGVDIEAAELMLAKQLGLDAVISHHPHGGETVINLFQVMNRQIKRMVEAGVPINKAQKALVERRGEVERNAHVSNYDRAVSAAKLLGMPYMGIHVPADVITERLVQDHLDQHLAEKPEATLQEVVDILGQLPEYQQAKAKPVIRVGSAGDYAGKVWVAMAGGTGGGPNVYKAYFEAGIGTLVVMHMPEAGIKAIREQNIGNVIVAGHMGSDSIGINHLIRVFREKGLEVVPMAGVIDV